MKAAAAALALLVAGCGGGTAEGDNAAMPAPPPAAVPTPVTPSTTLPPGEGIPGISAPPPVNHPAPVVGPDDAGAEAVGVLQTYFAALNDGRTADAYRLWGDRGGRSGMNEQAFADSFAKYASYVATIGAPGPVDAGAGQRYVTVPVKVFGSLRSGGPFTLQGPVTLHRTGDIDGTTAEQRSWRLYDSDLNPRPATG